MTNQPKDNAKVLCYWGPDTPGGEEAAICTFKADGFYLDETLQIPPTWWGYLDEFDTPKDAQLRSVIRQLEGEIERLKGKLNKQGCSRDQSTTQFCAEVAELTQENIELKERIAELERWAPKPMSEAPRDGSIIVAIDTLEWVCALFWDSRSDAWYYALGPRHPNPEKLIAFIVPPTAEELKQIGGAE